MRSMGFNNCASESRSSRMWLSLSFFKLFLIAKKREGIEIMTTGKIVTIMATIIRVTRITPEKNAKTGAKIV